jgi:tRNA U34 5-methylaminomethyl-2-thiouridine-forming methyltransferase MnmC
MKRKVIETEDRSTTLFVEELQEHYHSTRGALQESEHVFINAGYRHLCSHLRPLNILEVGFGTGLNALLTLRESIKTKRKARYVAIEPFEIGAELVAQMNYPQLMKWALADFYYKKLHEAPWEMPYFLDDFFILHKIPGRMQDVSLQEGSFHLIYFDAFGPDKQPEMWEQSVFEKCSHCLVRNGILTTYSSKGQVRRNLIAAGFEVEKIPGAKGKREMIRAIKK